MKTLLLAALICAGCTLPQVIYVDRLPGDVEYWNMPATQRWVIDPPMQPVKIPQWCRNPISHTVDPC